MKRSAVFLPIAAFVCASGIALAQDTMGQNPATQSTSASRTDSTASRTDRADPSPADSTATSSPTKRQAMKDCMTRERANNSGMSKTDARKACENEMMLQKENQGTRPPSQ